MSIDTATAVTPAVDPVAFYGAATIPEVLSGFAAPTGHGLVLVDADLAEQRMSYQELDAAARRSAYALRRRGVQPGDRVCLLSSTDLPLLQVLFGTWYAGAVPVILPLPRRRRDLDFYVTDVRRRVEVTGARVLAVTDAFTELFTALARDVPEGLVVAPMGELAAEERVLAEPLPDDPDAVALLQFTSGTTSASRAVVLTHRHLLTNMAGLLSTYDIGPGEVGMTWLPFNHDMGIIGWLGVMLHGCRTVLEAPEHFLTNPMSWLAAVSRYRASLIAAPNFAYALAGRLLRTTSRALDLSCVKWAINGAEPIDVEGLSLFTSAGERFGLDPNSPCPMYGLAEATLGVTLRPAATPLALQWVDRDELERGKRAVPVAPGSDGARRLVACGYPFPGTQIAIRDENGADLPTGHVGEIHIFGPGVMRGYWNDPEGTAEVIRDGWLRTGDLGYLSPDGLVICGRRKDMIIINGRNLFPEDYETEAERVPGIRPGNVIAFVLPGTERMVVVAEGRARDGDASPLAERVLEHLRQTLPTAPQEVVICPPSTIPKTTSGKRQRGRCRDLYLDGQLPVLGTASRRHHTGGDA